MSQTAAFLTRTGSIQVELPAPDVELMYGVKWGSVDAFPMPAYWAYQVLASRLAGKPPAYRLGRTLVEEVVACLLGGHGMPAPVGLAAYEQLRQRGALSGALVREEQLAAWLKEPLQVGARSVHYRFPAQKARYIAGALQVLQSAPDLTSGRQLRNWLLQVPGIGIKTASWIARNWLGADDVAILDIHIVRVGQVIGLFPRHLTVERRYLELEERFVQFSVKLDVRASELDAVIWSEMASSPATVRYLLKHLRETADSIRTDRATRTVDRQHLEIVG
jgi:N-glycosylase/DNA lyase